MEILIRWSLHLQPFTPNAVRDFENTEAAGRMELRRQMLTKIRVFGQSKSNKKNEFASTWEVSMPIIINFPFSQSSLFPTKHRHWFEAQ